MKKQFFICLSAIIFTAAAISAPKSHHTLPDYSQIGRTTDTLPDTGMYKNKTNKSYHSNKTQYNKHYNGDSTDMNRMNNNGDTVRNRPPQQ